MLEMIDCIGVVRIKMKISVTYLEPFGDFVCDERAFCVTVSFGFLCLYVCLWGYVCEYS